MRLATLLSALGLLMLTAIAAPAQTPPGVDHYLVYQVVNPPSFTVPVTLTDQFIQGGNYQTYTLEFFMTPVNKNNEGIVDPVAHYTWWRVTTYPFGAYALITNQFGPNQLATIGQPRYLLNPALKGLPTQGPPPPPPPLKNHYVAYDAASQSPQVTVSLEDQFNQLAARVDDMSYLATPAQKIFQGQVFPILDPIGHLAIYRITPLPPTPPDPGPVFATDEFGQWPLTLGSRVYLAVPSLKEGVVGTKRDTWGHLKALYH